MTHHRASHRNSAGQTLVEFALVLPVLFAFVGAVIQFGLVFWAQNTLTQVVRDTGRWAATQTFACTIAGAQAANPSLVTEANLIATNSALLGYTTGEWTTPLNDLTASPQPLEGVSAAWARVPASATDTVCPPKDNQTVWHVTIRIAHVVPVFFPGFQFLPGWSTCDGSAANGGVTGPCALLSSQADFRIEPAPAPLSQ